MGRKYEITHTQTFFPESLIHDVKGRSPGLRLVVYLPISNNRNSGFVDNNKLNSLQLRVQLKNFNLELRFGIYIPKSNFVVPKFALDSLLMPF